MYGGIKQRRDDRLETKKVKNIALKVEKAFDLAQSDHDPIDVDDDVALITKDMKRLQNCNKTPARTSKPNMDMKDVVCYHYQGKGHFSRNYF